MEYNIFIKQGNLLDEKYADFIVNASNSKLILGSGVSMAFKRHCGLKLQHEMNEIVRKLDVELQQEDVVATSSCNASNFQYVLHTVIMNYNKGIRNKEKLPTIKTIKTALKNIENYLLWYKEKNPNTIKLVLPLMGCGVGGLDKREVIQVYKEFFSRDVDINCEVVIYGYSIEDYQQIIKTMKKNQT